MEIGDIVLTICLVCIMFFILVFGCCIIGELGQIEDILSNTNCVTIGDEVYCKEGV